MTMRVPGGRGPTERSLLSEPTPLAERLTALPPVSSTERAAFATPDLKKALALPDIPADHKFCAQWNRRRREALSEAAQLWMRVLAMPTGRVGDEINQHIAFWSGLFDIRAKALLGFIVPSAYAEFFDEHAAAILAALEQQSFDVVVSEMIVARMAVRLQQRHAHWMAAMHAADQQLGADASAKDPFNATPRPMFRGITVSAKTKSWRRRKLGLYRKQQAMTAADLGRRLSLDPSVIRAIVREDWDSHKVNETNRSKLLKVLKIRLADWYAPR